MADQVIDNTVVDEAESQSAPPPPFNESTAPPSPADLPRHVSPQPQPEPESADGDGDGDGKAKGKGRKLETIEDYERALADQRKENAKWRTKLREVEPIVQKHQELEEQNKTELQKAQERAEAAEARDKQRAEDFDRLNLAVEHGIIPDNIDLLGSGSREQMEERALRVKAMQAQASTAPPTNRPVEGLRPGASPEPPRAADDSYPESWKPNHIRDNERTQHGI